MLGRELHQRFTENIIKKFSKKISNMPTSFAKNKDSKFNGKTWYYEMYTLLYACNNVYIS